MAGDGGVGGGVGGDGLHGGERCPSLEVVDQQMTALTGTNEAIACCFNVSAALGDHGQVWWLFGEQKNYNGFSCRIQELLAACFATRNEFDVSSVG